MRRSGTIAFVFLLALCLSPPGAQAQQRDVAGARDYPGIGRFAGSVITGYQVKDFDATNLQAVICWVFVLSAHEGG
jgi:hypothetical protein